MIEDLKNSNVPAHSEQSATDAELVGWVMERVNRWRQARDSEFAEPWKKYYSLWKGEWTGELKSKQAERSRLIAPALQQAVDQNVAEMVEATYGRGTWFDISDDIDPRIMPSSETFDFDSENYEFNKFNQQIVINEIEQTKTNFFVHAYIRGYKGKVSTATFEINTVEANPKFVENMKKLKFGDLLEVKGKIYHMSVKKEVDDAWGKETINTYKKCLQITSADPESYVKGYYKESDFAPVETEDTFSWDDKITWSEPVSKDSELPFNLD